MTGRLLRLRHTLGRIGRASEHRRLGSGRGVPRQPHVAQPAPAVATVGVETQQVERLVDLGPVERHEPAEEQRPSVAALRLPPVGGHELDGDRAPAGLFRRVVEQAVRQRHGPGGRGQVRRHGASRPDPVPLEQLGVGHHPVERAGQRVDLEAMAQADVPGLAEIGQPAQPVRRRPHLLQPAGRGLGQARHVAGVVQLEGHGGIDGKLAQHVQPAARRGARQVDVSRDQPVRGHPVEGGADQQR